jgi:hypothetical protein
VYNYFNPTINPRPAKVSDKEFESIVQQESFFQRFKGTIGRDIDWSKHPDGVVEAL